MKERPLLFTAPMVLAILAGRKTQTRRLVKPHPQRDMIDDWQNNDYAVHDYCPYGVAGDQIWVRETWARMGCGDFIYRADRWEVDDCIKWKPSIHIPRAGSRIQLQLTAVRVERVQDISEADCLAEGIQRCTKDGELYKYGWDELPWTDWKPTAKAAYMHLWQTLHGADSWNSNPWVWVLTFYRIPEATARIMALDAILEETNKQEPK